VYVRPRNEKLKERAAMADARELLTDELVQQVEDIARAENRKPAEVLQDAVTQYAEKQSWGKCCSVGRAGLKPF
jgi:predicted transcriptional regulator